MNPRPRERSWLFGWSIFLALALWLALFAGYRYLPSLTGLLEAW